MYKKHREEQFGECIRMEMYTVIIKTISLASASLGEEHEGGVNSPSSSAGDVSVKHAAALFIVKSMEEWRIS